MAPSNDIGFELLLQPYTAWSRPCAADGSRPRVSEAVQRMPEARRKILPITDSEGHMLGVVDRADLLASLHSAKSGDYES
jgi:CBS-domain-containing membrane protein